MASLGFPAILGGFTKAPFDSLGDTLRGTKGIMLDIYRQPDKLLNAMDTLVPLMIRMGVGRLKRTESPSYSSLYTKALTVSSPMSILGDSTGPLLERS